MGPSSQRPLLLEATLEENNDVVDGQLRDVDGEESFIVRRGVPRFVEADNYADNFGLQWNLFGRTQLDSNSGTTISEDRFWSATRWSPSQLEGKTVLDLGCGSGRFAEIALSAGALVYAVDLSSAVDACYSNLGSDPNLTVVQASVYQLPFLPESFDFVYSLGVIQHTPDPAATVAALARMVRPGGRMCVDVYWKRWQSTLHPRFALRPFTRGMDDARLFDRVSAVTPTLMGVNRVLRKVPFVGGALTRVIPVADYTGRLPLSPDQLEEWAVLDTFDWLGPAFDQPMSGSQLRAAFLRNGIVGVEVFHAGHLVATGMKPQD